MLHDGRQILEKVVEEAAAMKNKSKPVDGQDHDEQAIESMKTYVNSTKWMSKESLSAFLLEKVVMCDSYRLTSSCFGICYFAR